MEVSTTSVAQDPFLGLQTLPMMDFSVGRQLSLGVPGQQGL